MARPGPGYRFGVRARGATPVVDVTSATRFVEDGLAAWRLVRLAHSDYLTQPLRDRIYDALDGAAPGEDDPRVGTCECGHPAEQHEPRGEVPPRPCRALRCACQEYRPLASPRVARLLHPKLAALVECPYCLGVWSAAAVVLLRAIGAGWLVRVLAVSAVAAELARREAGYEARGPVSRPDRRIVPGAAPVGTP